ncbi:M23 family metallopeptidase [Parvularcula sp. ZS-1/3]|uniref:M23 family metallopeptidase n=1 Tax=Parvularcula mediterranea TaxID=2732508 RepID=A0A7Y3W6E0_9PROT|nr:M23 family metallopeptidase [Parvularcula mediterranea]NNU17634.1 M23 family metallopeptidase [Parvularcula mediterranea]
MVRFCLRAPALFLAVTMAASCASSGPSSSGTTSAPAGAAVGFRPEASLSLCPRQKVSNAPSVDGEGNVRGYKTFATVNGVRLLVNPAPGSCLSSNYGNRNGRLHKGMDFQSQPAGPVVAAAGGTVVEAGYRDDYGTFVLIDHGRGVYTRYAHLASATSAAKEGRQVKLGSHLGIMGNTASYRIPVHLHYEVLTGDYNTPKKSFGLTPVNLLSKMR